MMNNKKHWASSVDTLFPLDKAYKRGYNENNIPRKSKSIFDNDAFANAALDYLYSKNNRDKTKNFLANNGLPSFEDHEYNKRYYGEQEERKRILDLFKEKTNSILNPKLPDDTDRAFLSGLMGKEEEKLNYDKKLSSSNRALGELQDAFRGSQFEVELNPMMQRLNSTPAITNALNRNPNAKNEYNFGVRKNEIKDKIIEGIKDFFIPPLVNPKDHKKVWALGADTYLTMKGYHSSAWLLKHSLEDNPKDVYRDDNSRIAKLIKNDPAFLRELDKAIAESDGKTLETTVPVIFESGDLYYSIHKSNIKVMGYKGNDGKWKISSRLADKYDFTELTSWMDGKDATLGTLANDAAAFSQKLGAITPYHIYVDFNLER